MDGAECEVGRVRYRKPFIFGPSLLFYLDLALPSLLKPARDSFRHRLRPQPDQVRI